MAGMPLLLLLMAALSSVEGAKILLFPYGHCLNSHMYNMEKIAAILLKNGHEVTMLIHNNYTHAHADLDIERINLLTYTPPENVRIMCDLKSLNSYLHTPGKEVMDTFYDSTLRHCEAILENEMIMNKLKTSGFQLGIYDVVDPCSRIIADYVDVPFITFHSTGLDTLLPRNPAYLPVIMTPFSDDMTWWQRAVNTLSYGLIKLVSYSTVRKFEALKSRYSVNTSLTIANTLERASLKFVLGDFSLDYAGPMQPSTILVGGFIQQPSPKPLPENIMRVLEESNNGVVLLNFGTLVRHYDDNWQELFAAALAKLPYTVIWKYEGPEPKNLGNNTIIMPWVPQFSILAHRNTKVFITHSGFNSAYESAYHGVPVVAIPLFGEQAFQAVKLTERAGMGVRLSIHSLTSEQLTNAIMQVASDKSYKSNAEHVSDIMRSKPQSQESEILYWVDYVLRIGNMKHLRSRESGMYWYQVCLLDVVLVYFITAVMFYLSTKKVVRVFKSMCIQVLYPKNETVEYSSKEAKEHKYFLWDIITYVLGLMATPLSMILS